MYRWTNNSSVWSRPNTNLPRINNPFQNNRNLGMQAHQWGGRYLAYPNRRADSYQSNKYNFKSVKSQQTISLFSSSSDFNIFKYVSRDFSLKTKNTSGKFNKYFLLNSSSVISEFCSNNPDSNEFEILIQDDKNVLQKFEQLFQGETVNFTQEEIQICQDIAVNLNLKCTLFFYRRSEYQVSSYKITNFLEKIVKNGELKTFKIKTNKNVYLCNKIGVLSSSKIRDFISKNQNSDEFTFSFEDDQSEFKNISELFNFNSVVISNKNATDIKEIAEELGIDFILKNISDYIEKIEKVSQTIDDQQNITDLIDDIFDNLYHIDEKTVDYVSNIIEDSVWSSTEENVMELSAFILQVAQNTTVLQPYLIDLMVKLSENCSSPLKILIPFFVKKLMATIFNADKQSEKMDFIFSFLYQMIKRGLIPKDEFEDQITKNNIKNSYFNSWFMPELIQKGYIIRKDTKLNSFYMVVSSDSKTISGFQTENRLPLLYPCDTGKIEEFKIMRDKFEYDDEIARSLRKDDIDTFQSIITKGREKMLKNRVKKNMFEPFMVTNLRYLDYAAAYGSIKCFKYLLLNDEKPDNSTFNYAIIGGNNELIRIVDNEKKDVNNQFNKRKELIFINSLIETIKTHKNDLFDWILEQKISSLNQDELIRLAVCSIENCNSHSLIQIIDNGLNISDYSSNYSQFLELSAEKGFYLMTNLLLELISTNSKNVSISSEAATSFGNIEIFKLFSGTFKTPNLLKSIDIAIETGSLSIIKYIFELLDELEYKIEQKTAIIIFKNAIRAKSVEIMDFLFDKITQMINFPPLTLAHFLTEQITYKKVESSIKTAQLIYQQSSVTDFTPYFIDAAKNNLNKIISFLISNKYKVNNTKIAESISIIGNINVDLFMLIMKNIDERNQKNMIKCIDKAIQCLNKPLVKYLLDKDALLETSLINAVKTKDLELVEMVLAKNSTPLFINSCFSYGTALLIAVESNSLEICKKLISIEGINPSIYYKECKTPLASAALTMNEEIFDLLIKFYGNEIKNQSWQLEKAAEIVITNKNHEKISKILIKIIDLEVIDLNYLIRKIDLLNYACKMKEKDVFSNLIKRDNIDVNIYNSETGDTPLITSIKNNKNEITKILIENKNININQKNFDRKTALFYATTLKQGDIIDLLLNSNKFNPVESDLNNVFYQSELKVSKKFLSIDSLNVNFVPTYDPKNTSDMNYYIGEDTILKSKLIDAIIRNDEELFDLIINHNSFDKSLQQIVNYIRVAVHGNKIKMISKLLNLSDEIDINSRVFPNESSLLVNVISENPTDEMVSFILNSPDFDSSKSDISAAFSLFYLNIESISYSRNSNTISNHYKRQSAVSVKARERYPTMKTVEMLFDYDKNHEKLINLNECDKKTGLFPLEIAIQKRAINFANFLINTNKIDLNKHIHSKTSEYTTYLHLAASFGQVGILNIMLNSKLFDINIENDLGETPLMEACKSLQIEVIKALFKMDDLDFLHKDKKNRDAIQILKEAQNIEETTTTDNECTNKKQYLNILCDIFNRNQNNQPKYANIPKNGSWSAINNSKKNKEIKQNNSTENNQIDSTIKNKEIKQSNLTEKDQIASTKKNIENKQINSIDKNTLFENKSNSDGILSDQNNVKEFSVLIQNQNKSNVKKSESIKQEKSSDIPNKNTFDFGLKRPLNATEESSSSVSEKKNTIASSSSSKNYDHFADHFHQQTLQFIIKTKTVIKKINISLFNF